MWRKILRVFTAAVGVVVFYQVFKNGGVKIKRLVKDMLKTKAGEFIGYYTVQFHRDLFLRLLTAHRMALRIISLYFVKYVFN